MKKIITLCSFLSLTYLFHAQCTGLETYSNLTVSQCGPYTSPSGKIVSATGIFNDTIPNAVACDSIITIDLTVLNTTKTMSQTACDTYTAPDGAVYTTSGTKTAIIPNSAGCDSTITIILTVNKSTVSTITAHGCATYTAPDGQIYSSSDTITCIIPNKKGCDSTMTIYLTVDTITFATTTTSSDKLSMTAFPATGVTYQWIDCATNEALTSATNQIVQPLSGSYAVVVTNTFNCNDTSTCVNLVNSADLNDLKGKLNASLFPNPSEGKLLINAGELANLKLSISDVNGKIVYPTTSFNQTIELDINALNTGLYFVNLENNSMIERIKFVKK